MGLVKENYFVKKFGITIPKAYAYVDTQFDKLSDGRVKAYFNIQTSRESAANLKPLEVKTITFKVDRNQSLMVQAYIEAKKLKRVETGWDYEKSQPIVEMINGPFTDWDDYIV